MKICIECEHCVTVERPAYRQLCCRIGGKQNPITGEIAYDPCKDHNADGQCSEFEPKRRWYHWFCDKLMGP